MRIYPTRLEMMKDLLRPGSVICEIGVFTGQFAAQLLSLQPSKLFLIDPFQGMVPSGDADGNNVRTVFLPNVYLQLAEKVSKIDNCILLRGFSHELLPLLPQNCLDAIYIDGDHSYEGVKRDLQIAWHLVRTGGYICGHDYEPNLTKTSNQYDFGVKRAVDEFCQEKGLTIFAKGRDGQVSFAIEKIINPPKTLSYYIEPLKT